MKVAAVVAHPDDELMCAGTLARFATEGHDTTIVVCCNSYDDGRDEEAARCAEILGAVLDYDVRHDDALLFDRSAVAELEILDADLYITHRVTDTNQSHITVAQIMRAVARKNQATIWLLDQALPGGIDTQAPRPNLYVNTSDYIDTVRDAVGCYRGYDEWCALEDRARYYGSLLGVARAEAFHIEKSIWL